MLAQSIRNKKALTKAYDDEENCRKQRCENVYKCTQCKEELKQLLILKIKKHNQDLKDINKQLKNLEKIKNEPDIKDEVARYIKTSSDMKKHVMEYKKEDEKSLKSLLSKN